MVKQQAEFGGEALDAVFSALADPTRRAILARLAQGKQRVTDLAEPFAISLPAVSKHLRVLEEAGLIARTVRGRVHLCRLEAAAMQSAAEWIEVYRRFWEGQLDSLTEYLSGMGSEMGGGAADGKRTPAGGAPISKKKNEPEDS